MGKNDINEDNTFLSEYPLFIALFAVPVFPPTK